MHTENDHVTIRRIIDGDTIEVTAHVGYQTHIDITLRLLGVDTAETYGVDHDSHEYEVGKEHEQFVRDWISERDKFYVRTDERGKFGRWLGELFDGDGNSLNDALVEQFPSVVR